MSASSRSGSRGGLVIIVIAIIIALSQFLSSQQEAAKEQRIKTLEQAVQALKDNQK